MGRSVAIIGTRGYPSYYGGFETAIRRLAPFLAEQGWNVTVYGRPGTNSQKDPDRDVRVLARQTRGFETKSLSTLSYGGPIEEAVRALAEQNPRVHWFGHLSDDIRLHSLWQHAGASFHGHSVGGTNPALVQAMACAAPVVAPDTVFNREVLHDAGRFIAPDADSIAKGVLAVLCDPIEQERLSCRGQAQVREADSWAEVNVGYERLLLHVLAARSASAVSRSRA